MSKTVTIILDSGCLMRREKGTGCEIGYFQCGDESDITIDADRESIHCEIKLGTKCSKIDIQHIGADGNPKTDGIKIPEPFHDKLLHMYDLYDCGISVATSRDNFDCILSFKSGEFRAIGEKLRRFTRHKLLTTGTLATEVEATKEKLIVHDLTMGFTLGDRESIVFTRGEEKLWSSDSLSDKDDIKIKIKADASTTEKFYRQSFASGKEAYWMPNAVDDPPPWCPEPPCPDAQ